ncbi:Ankyrin repeat protein [Trichoderma simmonsii]|uniref:Ankyrin repeat protein n=1 Tax=Trichoderma simmonsii TaxID=1491479 RepID=A0A8G0PI26_9HYPO|nr:Ankyrin repeat protein [Trichoderma simmonsii]
MASGNIATDGSKQVNTWVQLNLFKQVVHGTANAAISVIAAVAARIRGSSTVNDFNLWSRAYEVAQERQGELMKDFMKYLDTLHITLPPGTNRDVMDPSYAECVVDKLFAIREENGISLSVRKAHTEIREEIEKLAKFLLWSDSIVKTAVNSEPHVALAWSGVSLFLLAVSNSQAYNIDMLRDFNTINDIQIFWKDVEEAYLASPHYHHLKEPLAQLYSHIVEYQAWAICHTSKPPVSRTFYSVAGSKTWSGSITSVKNMEQTCLSYITGGQQAEIYEISRNQLLAIEKQVVLQEEILQSFKNNKQGDLEQKLLCDLAKVAGDYQRCKNFHPLRVPGTCEWFLADERFRQWRNSQIGAFLWVSASPGCGKSVLTRFLIEEGHLIPDTTMTIETSAILASRTPSVICYFFYRERGEGQMDVTQGLCAILQQLFQHPLTSNLIAHAVPSHRIQQDTLTQKLDELWKILIDCANSSSVEIICVLDALDECKEDRRKEFVGLLEKLYNPNNTSLIPSKLKFLITSRPYENLETLFKRFSSFTAYLHIDGDDKSGQIGEEINLVIDIKLNDIAKDFSQQDRDMISHRLKSMENRTYLWLHLTLGIIEDKMSCYSRGADIEEFLSQLPSRVADAYEEILSKSQDEEKVETLLQIVLAATRPLTLDEANCALTLALEKGPVLSEERLRHRLWPRSRFKATLQNLCGLFISIYDSSLLFIHQTAKEFLIHPEHTAKWKGRFNLPKSHGILSEACIKYLQILDPSCQHPKDEYPLFAYAAKTWPLHFRSQDADSTKLLRKSARELCRVSDPRRRFWINGSGTSYYKNKLPDLHLATYLGLAAIVHDMLVYEHADGNEEIDCFKTPLDIAILQGHLDVMKTLLESAHERKITCGESHMMAAVGHRQKAGPMITMLLEKYGDEVNVTESVLLRAAKNPWMGGTTAFAMLLNRGGDEIKITEKMVSEIALGGSVETMALLLNERGDEFKITKDAIISATLNKKEMLDLLLQRRRHEIEISEAVIKASMQTHYPETLKLVLDSVDDKDITARLVVAAADDCFQGLAKIPLLLDKGGHEIKMTEDILKAAAGNRYSGLEIITFLLDKYGHEIEMTEDIVKAAVQNDKQGLGIVSLLLDRCGHEITITEDIVKEALRNCQCGPDIISLLLDERGHKIYITEDIMAIAQERGYKKDEMLVLFREGQNNGKDVIRD